MNAVAVVLMLVSFAAPGAAADLRAVLPDVAPDTGAPLAESPAEYDSTTLSNFIDGGAETYLDFGFVRAITAEYGSGDEVVTCTVYKMKDPAAAFGIFSYLRGGRNVAGPIGDGSFAADLQVAFWQDRYVATVETFSLEPRTREKLAAFARAISTRINAHATAPVALSRLPAGRIDGSELLLRGRVAANALYTSWPSTQSTFGRGDDLVGARYASATGDTTLWLASFHDRAALDTAWTSLSKLRVDAGCAAPPTSSGDEPTRTVFCIRNGRTNVARQRGDGIVVVIGARSAEDASALAGQVKP